MRWKITVANSAIVLLTTVVSFILLQENLNSVPADDETRRAEAERAVVAVTNQLELDSLRIERWLAFRVGTDSVRSVFESGTRQARGANATLQANRLREEFARTHRGAEGSPSLVVFVDAEGFAIGRNDSSQMRGENLATSYPSLKAALLAGGTSSHLWLSERRSEQLTVSYATVDAHDGSLLGAVVVGSPIGDERMSRLSSQTSGLELILCNSPENETARILAVGRVDRPTPSQFVLAPATLTAASQSLQGHRVVLSEGSRALAAQRLRGLGATQAFVIARAKSTVVLGLTGLLWPLAASAALGLLLVASAGAFLANYISQPIAELEQGLLSVINGRTNHRFELEHKELGGLVSHLNSLLNSLMDVPEIDHTGRTSYPAGAAYQDPDEP